MLIEKNRYDNSVKTRNFKHTEYTDKVTKFTAGLGVLI